MDTMSYMKGFISSILAAGLFLINFIHLAKREVDALLEDKQAGWGVLPFA